MVIPTGILLPSAPQKKSNKGCIYPIGILSGEKTTVELLINSNVIRKTSGFSGGNYFQ
jgi:hypothetical protein